MHIVSLDASKAFDKLWSFGTFFKLIDKVSPCIWRILFNYCQKSKIFVTVDGNSRLFETPEGFKQGGTISTYLSYHSFIKELYFECVCKAW